MHPPAASLSDEPRTGYNTKQLDPWSPSESYMQALSVAHYIQEALLYRQKDFHLITVNPEGSLILDRQLG